MAAGDELNANCKSDILTIAERDEDVVHAVVRTATGTVTVFATVTRREDTLHLSQVHVEGQGLTRAVIKQAAREMGHIEGAATVKIQGGKRTSGARPGTVPSPIVIEVKP